MDRILTGVSAYAVFGGKPGESRQIALVHNLDTPLIDALPRSLPGRGLSATAFGPFYDAKIGKILDNLLGRASVSEVEVIIQQDTNTLDVQALRQWCQRHQSVEICVSGVDLPGRPLHAKGLLLRDSRGKPVLAMVGSANLTDPALLRSQAGGGNVEVGLWLQGSAATVVQQALARPPFSERQTVDLADVRSRPQVPARKLARRDG